MIEFLAWSLAWNFKNIIENHDFIISPLFQYSMNFACVWYFGGLFYLLLIEILKMWFWYCNINKIYITVGLISVLYRWTCLDIDLSYRISSHSPSSSWNICATVPSNHFLREFEYIDTLCPSNQLWRIYASIKNIQ